MFRLGVRVGAIAEPEGLELLLQVVACRHELREILTVEVSRDSYAAGVRPGGAS